LFYISHFLVLSCSFLSSFICLGNFFDKAEIACPGMEEANVDNVNLYRSCLNFEVKVFEQFKEANTAYEEDEEDDIYRTDDYQGSPQQGAANAANANTQPQRVNFLRHASADGCSRVDKCVLCVGVLLLNQKVPLSGSGEEHTATAAAAAAPDSEEDLLSPKLLQSGKYEVLLYTLYNPDAEVDVALVGKVVVQVNISDSRVPTSEEVLALRDPQLDIKFSSKKFHSMVRSGDVPHAFAYWLQSLEECCANILQFDEVFDRFAQAEAENTAAYSAAGGAAAPQEVLEQQRLMYVKDSKFYLAAKAQLFEEYNSIVLQLSRSMLSEKLVHTEVAHLLVHNNPQKFVTETLPALHVFLQVIIA
jgi:hypothetical protein